MGGFESILSQMTGSNFNWFLHVMLFMHTVKVIQKQQEKMMESEEEEEEQNDTDVENE
jgi:hypothetical protein